MNDDVRLSERLRSYYQTALELHADDPLFKICQICLVSECPDWRTAYNRLVLTDAATSDLDPLPPAD